MLVAGGFEVVLMSSLAKTISFQSLLHPALEMGRYEKNSDSF